MANESNRKESADELSEGIARCAVACPMCGHKHTQYRLNPHLYWFTDMEMDRKPTGFHCRRSLEGYYPSLYEMWHCPQCHFTAHNRVFPDPLKNVYIDKKLVGRRLADRKQEDASFLKVLETLGTESGFEQTDFVQAIRLSLLAIYFQHFLHDMLSQHHAALARSYLRLGWLYRDWTQMRTEAEQRADRERLDTTWAVVRPHWPACCEDEAAALAAACHWFAEAMNAPAAAQDPLETSGMMMQVARIHMQRKDYDTARIHLRDCRRSITEELDRVNRKMTEDLHVGKLSEEDRGRMLSDSRKYRAMLDECEVLQDTISKSRAATDRQRAQEILAANRKAAPATLRKLLADAEIPTALIRELVPEQKSGLLGGLFR